MDHFRDRHQLCHPGLPNLWAFKTDHWSCWSPCCNLVACFLGSGSDLIQAVCAKHSCRGSRNRDEVLTFIFLKTRYMNCFCTTTMFGADHFCHCPRPQTWSRNQMWCLKQIFAPKGATCYHISWLVFYKCDHCDGLVLHNTICFRRPLDCHTDCSVAVALPYVQHTQYISKDWQPIWTELRCAIWWVYPFMKVHESSMQLFACEDFRK